MAAISSSACWKGREFLCWWGFRGRSSPFSWAPAYGLVSGYAGGKTDAAMMRAVEILYSIPRLVIILVFINSLR